MQLTSVSVFLHAPPSGRTLVFDLLGVQIGATGQSPPSRVPRSSGTENYANRAEGIVGAVCRANCGSRRVLRGASRRQQCRAGPTRGSRLALRQSRASPRPRRSWGRDRPVAPLCRDCGTRRCACWRPDPRGWRSASAFARRLSTSTSHPGDAKAQLRADRKPRPGRRRGRARLGIGGKRVPRPQGSRPG